MNAPPLESTATARLVITPDDLASALRLGPKDTFPAVFDTARMVALMEIASARLLGPYLGPGELSVGVGVEIIHTAPTPLKAAVTAFARYVGLEGKLFVFEVVASDPGGEIGRGRHTRAVVNAERLQGIAARRLTDTAPHAPVWQVRRAPGSRRSRS